MSATDAAGGHTAKSSGRLSKALIALFMKRAAVGAIDDIGSGFRLVTLQGPALRGVAWTAGQKIQVGMGSAFASRTYTPLEWNMAEGRTRLLGYVHGSGPGSDWLLGLKVGDECDIFGPRRSVAVQDADGPIVVFGDETSIGLAHALCRQARDRSVICRFELGDAAGADRVLQKLDIRDAMVVARSDDGRHLDRLEASFAELAGKGASFILTGNAGSIQRLRQGLRRLDVPASRIVTKAYWAVGKVGLD